MADFGSRRIDEALASLAASDQPGAAGVVSALGGAAAAALLELSAGLTARRLAAAGDTAGSPGGGSGEAAAGSPAEAQRRVQRRAGELKEMLLETADADAAAYARVIGADDSEARASGLDSASEPPLAVAVHCAELAAAAAGTAKLSRAWAFNADAIVAARVAAACAESAAALVAENAEPGSGDPRIERARDAAGQAAASAREAAGPARS